MSGGTREPCVELAEPVQLETGTERLERRARRLEFAARAARLPLFEKGTGEQRACAGPVEWCVGVTPKIRGPSKTFHRARAVAVGEKHCSPGTVGSREDCRAREDGRELGEFGGGGSRGRELVAGEGDLD